MTLSCSVLQKEKSSSGNWRHVSNIAISLENSRWNCFNSVREWIHGRDATTRTQIQVIAMNANDLIEAKDLIG